MCGFTQAFVSRLLLVLKNIKKGEVVVAIFSIVFSYLMLLLEISAVT